MDFSQLSHSQLEERLLAESDQQTVYKCCQDSAATRLDTSQRRALLRTRLDAARELLLRDEHEVMLGRTQISSPAAVRDHLRIHLARLPYEAFIVVFVDSDNRVLACEEMFRGSLTATSVYPREVVTAALEAGAAACVFAHNHPSGYCEPTQADEHLTRALKDTLSLVDVRVLDHLIFAAGRFCSFAECGLL